MLDVKVRLLVLRFAENVARANHGILAIRSGLAVEAKRILEIESDDGRACELEQEIAQRAYGDGVRDGGALGVWCIGVARVHFPARAAVSRRSSRSSTP